MMKRTVIAFLMGVALATAGSAYAEEISTMIGKTIQGEFPVKVNGESLDKKAIVVDGTSYLPVRAIGEALNMDIKFDADLGIELTEKEAPTLESSTLTEMSQDDVDAIKRAENQIAASNQRIAENEAKIADLESQKGPIQEQINQTTDSQRLMYLKADLESLQIQIDAANEQIRMAQEGITQLQAYIEKIKAKYATP